MPKMPSTRPKMRATTSPPVIFASAWMRIRRREKGREEKGNKEKEGEVSHRKDVTFRHCLVHQVFNHYLREYEKGKVVGDSRVRHIESNNGD